MSFPQNRCATPNSVVNFFVTLFQGRVTNACSEKAFAYLTQTCACVDVYCRKSHLITNLHKSRITVTDLDKLTFLT